MLLHITLYVILFNLYIILDLYIKLVEHIYSGIMIQLQCYSVMIL